MKKTIKRIGNIGFAKSTYLCDEPEIPSYDILKFEENTLYGKDKTGEYVQDEFGWYHRADDSEEYPTNYAEGCFKNKEYCYVLANFEYDAHEPCWELRTVRDRPVDLKGEDIQDFWDMMTFGFKWLKKHKHKNNNLE